MSLLERRAIEEAVAIAGLSALVTGLVSIGVDEVKVLLAERREKRRES